jgi:large repetitive protein
MSDQHRSRPKMQAKNSTCTTNTARARVKNLSALLVFFAGAVSFATEAAFATIENTATATASYNGDPVVSNPDTASVPVDAGTPALVVDKTADDTTNVVAGQVVTYTYVVRNAGTQTLTNVSLNDAHNGAGPAPVPGNEVLSSDAGVANDSADAAANDGVWSILAPGDAITMQATYTVMQADVDSLQ